MSNTRHCKTSTEIAPYPEPPAEIGRIYVPDRGVEMPHGGMLTMPGYPLVFYKLDDPELNAKTEAAFRLLVRGLPEDAGWSAE